jgi:hypothetical protein
LTEHGDHALDGFRFRDHKVGRYQFPTRRSTCRSRRA